MTGEPAIREPLRILSDLHLGHRASRIERVESLDPLLDGVTSVICNGDTWQELALEFRQSGQQMLDQWRASAAKRNADLVLLPGNHDPGSVDSPFLDLANGSVFVSHGDILFPEGAPWSRMLASRHGEVERLWQQAGGDAGTVAGRVRLAGEIARVLAPEKQPRGRSLLARIWDAATPPTRAWHMLKSWAAFPTEAARFLDRFRPHASVFVCGHFHRAGIWRRGNRTIINTGSFVPPGPAWCVDLSGRQLEVKRIDHCDGNFVVGRTIRSLQL